MTCPENGLSVIADHHATKFKTDDEMFPQVVPNASAWSQRCLSASHCIRRRPAETVS